MLTLTVRSTSSLTCQFLDSVLPGDIAGFIAVDYTNELLVVAFRDTMSRINGRTDLEFLQIEAPTVCAGCRIHSGFFQAAAAAILLLTRPLQEARNQYPNHTIVMTGHSLGGALATMYTVFLRARDVYVDLVTPFQGPNLYFQEHKLTRSLGSVHVRRTVGRKSGPR
jgi:triacylglycerol lipase